LTFKKLANAGAGAGFLQNTAGYDPGTSPLLLFKELSALDAHPGLHLITSNAHNFHTILTIVSKISWHTFNNFVKILSMTGSYFVFIQ
jgi:hypothetical protein